VSRPSFYPPGWEEGFKKMLENSDDALLIPDNIENDFAWEW
jgi:hypothetical protein